MRSNIPRIFALATHKLRHMSISTRLFAVVFATSIVVVIAMATAANWSFKRGFVGYLNEQAVLRLEEIMPRVTAAYIAHGSWDFLRERPETWYEITRPLSDKGQAQRFIRGESKPPVSDLTGAFLRLTLLDADRHYILGLRIPPPGDRSNHRVRRPIVVDGLTVGWLALEPFQRVSEVGARRFQAGQFRASWVIGLLAIILAAGVAWWISRAILRPIRRVAQATHELAGGDYSRRVPVASDDEVGRLALDFNHLAHTLEDNERLRRDFMADISHELRTPLGVLNGEIEAMQDGIRPIGPQALQNLRTEVSILSKLVDDLHDLALTDVAALAYRKAGVDLAMLVQHCSQAYADAYARKGLVFSTQTPDHPLTVFADAKRLQQLIFNLLENSLRYTDAGGQVVLELLPPGPDSRPGYATLRLMDSSPGVLPEQLDQLFERFYRAEPSRSRASGGSGLGLPICQRIVEAHDGSISAATSPFGGLQITVELPIT